MNIEKIKQALDDPGMSDKEYFSVLLQELSDGNPEPSNLEKMLEMEELSHQERIKRPVAHELLRQHVINQHKDCCGPVTLGSRLQSF